MNGPVGVLIMAHGTPAGPEEIAAFYTRIRRGRPPSAEQLADLEGRYAAIGGLSPLTARTVAQVEGIRARLEAGAPGRYVVACGAKHAAPLIEDAVAELRHAGVASVIGLVLTPHGSSLGSQEYLDRAEAALAGAEPFVAVPPWYAEPGFVALVAERVTDALAGVTADGDRSRYPVVFTAHSLPARIRQAGDSYPEQLAQSAALVAAAAGLTRWEVAWQSAGRTPEPWLGPDIRDVVGELAADADGVVVCPIGFVTDHLEVLYDLDVELAAVAEAAGLVYARTASLNDDPRFLDVLADVIDTADAARAVLSRTLGRVVVVGGGISGLAAAWELSGGRHGVETDPDGAEGSGAGIVVIESTSRLGGALDSATFGGRIVDTGPDGFLGRRPEALDLCHEVGLGDGLVPIGGRGAGVWARGRVRPLPAGLALGIPTRFWPAARAGILGFRGQVALARDALLPRPDSRGPIGDRAIGPLVARKLGRRVADLLVDPLIGGIHAGSVEDMSAAATYPPLLAAAQKRGSLMRALRAEVPAPPVSTDEAPPLFWALDGGMAALVERLHVALVERGVEFRFDTPVLSLERLAPGAGGSPRWNVVTGTDGAGPVDRRTSGANAVVLAVPAPAAAELLRAHDDEAAGLLAGIAYASVTLVTFRVALDALPAPLSGTGFLVPRHSPAPRRGEPWAVTACTYLSNKWPHLAVEGEVLLRASLGRYGDNRAQEWSDDEVSERAWSELGLLMGLLGEPLEARVARWPQAFPQYRVHHLMRTAGIEAAVARLGGIAVAGSAYRGVGIPACIASGRAAARAVT